MKTPLRTLILFASSPQGRRMLLGAWQKLNTPENRRKAQEAYERYRAGKAAPDAPPSRTDRLPDRRR